MKYKSLYIVFASSLLILFVLVYEGSFAYFTSNITDNRGLGAGNTTISTADLEDLTLVNGENTDSNLWIPGTSKNFKFSISNPGSVDLCVKLVWKNVSNTWVNKEDLVYTLTDAEGNVIEDSAGKKIENIQFPSTENEVLVESFKVLHKETPNDYIIKVTYINTEENQYEDMGQSFSATVEGQLTDCSMGGG